MALHLFLTTAADQNDLNYRVSFEDFVLKQLISLIESRSFELNTISLIQEKQIDSNLDEYSSMDWFIQWFLNFAYSESYIVAQLQTSSFYGHSLTATFFRTILIQYKLKHKVKLTIFQKLFHFFIPFYFYLRFLNWWYCRVSTKSQVSIVYLFEHHLSHLISGLYIPNNRFAPTTCLLDVIFLLAVCVKNKFKGSNPFGQYWIYRFIDETDRFFDGRIRSESNQLFIKQDFLIQTGELSHFDSLSAIVSQLMQTHSLESLNHLLGFTLKDMGLEAKTDVVYMTNGELRCVLMNEAPHTGKIDDLKLFQYLTESHLQPNTIRDTLYSIFDEHCNDDFFILSDHSEIPVHESQKIIGFPYTFIENTCYIVILYVDYRRTFFLESKLNDLRIILKMMLIQLHYLFQFSILFGSIDQLHRSNWDDNERLPADSTIDPSSFHYSLGFIANHIFHEMNNPLATMISGLECIEDLSSDHPMISTFLSNINAHSQRIQSLTHVFVKLDRHQLNREEFLEVNEVIDDVLLIFDKTLNDLGVKVDCDFAYLPKIKVSYYVLTQIVSAVLLNSIEASAKDGVVYIRTYYCLPSKKRSSSIGIDILDYGTGISDDDIKCVFNPFFSTKPHHLGLGLTQVLGLVTKEGYSVDLQSQQDEQTQFSLFLPIQSV